MLRELTGRLKRAVGMLRALEGEDWSDGGEVWMACVEVIRFAGLELILKLKAVGG